MRRLAKEHRPKLIVCGGSAYPRAIEAERFREIADEVGALLLCDMAHFAGLVAAGLHPNPVPHCDFVTSTTHKTLAGPRAASSSARRSTRRALDKAVFPGMQGGPLLHTIAAKATCFKIAASEPFRALPGADPRERRRARRGPRSSGGLDLLTGGTDTHLMQLDLRGASGRARTPRSACTRSRSRPTATPCRSTSGRRPSPPGVRLGTPAVTMRGFDEDDLREVGAIIAGALADGADTARSRERSQALCERQPLYPGLPRVSRRTR